jgi:hypothetical protein
MRGAGAAVVVAIAGCSGGGSNGPADVLRSMFNAVDSGDISEANSYYLSEIEGDRPQRQRDTEIREIDNRSLDTISDTLDSSSDELEEFGDSIATELTVDVLDWTFVYYDIDWIRDHNYAWMAEVEDGWKIGLLAAFGP